MKKIYVLILVVLVAAVTFSVVLADGNGCEGRKFIPERVPAKCKQVQAEGGGEGIGQEDKDERHRVNVLYHPYVELYPYMDTGW